MMFLVLFGSLAAAMAVVAQSNLRTADSALHVSRAMSAAETGLVFAARRLQEQARRFVVDEGVIAFDFGDDLWSGNLAADEFLVLDPDGYVESSEPAGIMQAIAYLHDTVDVHAFDAEPADASLPSIDADTGTLVCKPIRLGSEADDPYFRLRYELVAIEGDPAVRITSVGVDGDVERRLEMGFRLVKRIPFAALSPNRIMIGKNVLIDGPIGTLYGVDADRNANPDELDLENGDPIVVRSDFYDLDPDLDALLDLFYAEVADHDVDGDSRLRPNHPDENDGVVADEAFVDLDGNEYVDDFDLFLGTFDTNLDGRVCYDSALALEVGLGALATEYGDDPGEDNQLMVLIDERDPDRDDDGDLGDDNDRLLGYRDGVVDANDRYAKIHGRIDLAVAESDWVTYHGESWQTVVRGPTQPDVGGVPVEFEKPEEDMIEVTTGMFSAARDWYVLQVDGPPPTDLEDPPQDPADLASVATVAGTYYPPGSPPAGVDVWEAVPFGSPGAYDFYRRPVYEGFTFENVRIPRGNNALFIDCTFVGVTYVETVSVEDTEGTWNFTGAADWTDADFDGIVEDGEVVIGKFRDPDDPASVMLAELPNGTDTDNTRLYSNNLRFHDCTFLGSIVGDRIGGGGVDDPTYTHWRTKVQITGASRFYIDPEDEDLLDQPDAADLQTLLNAMDPAFRAELAKSSILMPGWSVDAGSFQHDAPRLKLSGTIVAGVFDIRGRAVIDGTLLMTFRPRRGLGPLLVMGSIAVDRFNTTIGYFSTAAGDSEGNDPSPGEYGEIRIRYDEDGILPDGIPWPVSIETVEGSYFEGGL